MPEFEKPRRRQLKMVPDPETQLGALVRALEAIAEGVHVITETLDSIIVNAGGEGRAIRTVAVVGEETEERLRDVKAHAAAAVNQ